MKFILSILGAFIAWIILSLVSTQVIFKQEDEKIFVSDTNYTNRLLEYELKEAQSSFESMSSQLSELQSRVSFVRYRLDYIESLLQVKIEEYRKNNKEKEEVDTSQINFVDDFPQILPTLY